MTTETTVVAFRRTLGEMRNQVQFRKGSVVITKDGKPVAALTDATLFERSAAEHLKQEPELATVFRKHGLEGYVPDVNAFRVHAQKIYLASDEAKEWPKGMLEKINALK